MSPDPKRDEQSNHRLVAEILISMFRRQHALRSAVLMLNRRTAGLSAGEQLPPDLVSETEDQMLAALFAKLRRTL